LIDATRKACALAVAALFTFVGAGCSDNSPGSGQPEGGGVPEGVDRRDTDGTSPANDTSDPTGSGGGTQEGGDVNTEEEEGPGSGY
jgi:hypothetical protein